VLTHILANRIFVLIAVNLTAPTAALIGFASIAASFSLLLQSLWSPAAWPVPASSSMSASGHR
jgi:hypothetical protein